MTSIKRNLLAAAGALVVSVGGVTGTSAADSISIANYGGAYGDAMWTAIWAPAAEDLKISINKDTLAGIADVRAQVKANAVQWDIGELTVDECAVGEKEGLFEPLSLSSDALKGYDKSAVHPSYVLVNTSSYVLAWNKDKPALKSWADFWDTQKFPGTRALRDDPLENIIVALLADGVPLDEVYPPDVDRAFKKLEQIKPSIVTWWASGAQSAQLLGSGEADYVGIWATRAGAAIKEGANAEFTWNEGILIPDCLFIPKGAPNAGLAKKVLERVLKADLQAKLPTVIDASPVNSEVYEQNLIPADLMAKQATSPENLKIQVWTDGEWWAANGAAVREKWSAFKLQ
ncbi:ABC transporter substrate-binding protein [Sinorhizobium meliloti]|uniref:ABC transporter substrate-binding protein n=1 Tax=Rhizobium meliloti TaxID=382 RepID=UPI003D64EBAA